MANAYLVSAQNITWNLVPEPSGSRTFPWCWSARSPPWLILACLPFLFFLFFSSLSSSSSHSPHGASPSLPSPSMTHPTRLPWPFAPSLSLLSFLLLRCYATSTLIICLFSLFHWRHSLLSFQCISTAFNYSSRPKHITDLHYSS